MREFIRNIYYRLFSPSQMEFLKIIKSEIKNRKLKGEILKYLSKDKSIETDIIKQNLQSWGIAVFPYPWANFYNGDDIQVNVDVDGDCYVIHNGKRLYGKKGWPPNRLSAYYNDLLREQDEQSPHRYLKEGRYPTTGSVVVDIGAAEGIFALDVIEYASKVYLFEADETWLSALKKTFSPWENKIEIITKYVGKNDTEKEVSLDCYFSGKECDYIKADIEGAEEAMLRGGEMTFREKVRQSLVCVYHRDEDEKAISFQLNSWNFQIEVNDGFMLFLDDSKGLKPPYLRHGVIYAKRCD